MTETRTIQVKVAPQVGAPGRALLWQLRDETLFASLPIEAEVVGADRPFDVTFKLDVNERDEPVIFELRIRRRADGPELTQSAMRQLPLRSWIPEAVQRAAHRVNFPEYAHAQLRSTDRVSVAADRDDEGNYEWVGYSAKEPTTPPGTPDIDRRLALAGTDPYLQWRRSPSASSNLRVNDQVLHDVAEIYRVASARGDYPVRAVASVLSRPRGTATRWVGRARERGFLPPWDGTA